MTTAAKSVAHRPRPATALVSAHSTSFPSGYVGGDRKRTALLTVLLPMLHSRFTLGTSPSRWRAVQKLTVGAAVGGVERASSGPTLLLARYLYFLVCLCVFRPPSIYSGAQRASHALSPPVEVSRPEPEVDGPSSHACICHRTVTQPDSNLDLTTSR